jgi:hypothetical protein
MNTPDNKPELIEIRDADGNVIAMLPSSVLDTYRVERTENGGRAYDADGNLRVRWGDG